MINHLLRGLLLFALLASSIPVAAERVDNPAEPRDGRVGLIQEFPGAVSFVDAKGDPAGRITVGGTAGGISSLTGCLAAGEVLLTSGTHFADGPTPNIQLRVNYLERIDADGVFARQVAFAAPHDGQAVGVFLSGPDHVIVVKGYFESLAAQFGTGATFSGDDEEPETPEVIYYEIER